MKYLTESYKNYLTNLILRQESDTKIGQKLIIMVESIPEANLLAVANAIESKLGYKGEISFTLKIAKALIDQWGQPGKVEAGNHNWIAERDNLTFYRSMPPVEDKINVIILCGSDIVTDSASLADFHVCNMKVIWERELGCSFSKWINKKLEEHGIDSIETKELKSFDLLLKPLIDYSRSDLIKMSDWLTNLDLGMADNVREVKEIMLENLDYFGLPKFSSFDLGNRKKTLAPYIDKAISFFNYAMFMEETTRKKATKAIVGIQESVKKAEDNWDFLDDEKVKGDYNNGEEFLQGLLRYIHSNDQNERETLLTCDFVTILDKIFKYKKKTEKKQKGEKKVQGSPVEMTLTALWDCLYELYHDKETESDSEIGRIEINSDYYKYDIEGEEFGVPNSTLDYSILAMDYLGKLIGGIDEIIMQHLNLKNESDGEVEVKCQLLNNDISCQHKRSAESKLGFTIYIYLQEQAKPFQRKYAWRLPENHTYQLAKELIALAKKSLDDLAQSYHLPVFHIPYYDELLNTSSIEERKSVFLHCIGDADKGNSFQTNLLSDEWVKGNDPLLPKLKELAEKYHTFICSSADNGLIHALFSDSWSVLRQTYVQVLQKVTDDIDLLLSPLCGMLLRTFMIIRSRHHYLGSGWFAEPYEQSGVLTVLHPAVLEMLQAQIVYNTSCFNYAVNHEIAKNNRKEAFKKHIWKSYLDLANIRSPLTGLLYNEEQNLSANMRGSELIHCIGSPILGEDALSTRLMLSLSDYSEDEYDIISDTEMFQETSESKLLLRLMLDYFLLHPHTKDGLSLAVYRNKDIQPVIAAIHTYLSMLANVKETRYFTFKEESDKKYTINITVFTDSIDDSDITRWIEQWRIRWESAETEEKIKYYRRCRISISHRLIVKNDYRTFQRMINDNFDADIAVFYDFIGAGSGVNKFERVEPFDIRTYTLQFPILEKSVATIKNPQDYLKRSRVISNRQFTIGAMHANLMYCLKTQQNQTGTVVIGTGDFKPWKEVINALHKKTEWVVCIDPCVDDRLLKNSCLDGELEREIIGFGSGVGPSGEDNYTISTEQFSLADVQVQLCASIKALFAQNGWSEEEFDKVAKGVLNVARELSGISLVRATGVDDMYIHDFMAFALARKILNTKEHLLCDNLITLDAYRHWFDFSENNRRPDLMWLKAKIGSDKRLHLELHLIECKMGNESNNLLINAKAQLENGLQVLVSAFAPIKADNEPEIDDDRPDRRYWWMQLHRLIASKAEIEKNQQNNVIYALERLAEGDFDITWRASIFAYWINDLKTDFKKIYKWEVSSTIDNVANIYVIGNTYIQKIAISEKQDIKEWNSFYDMAIEETGGMSIDLDDVEILPGEDEDDNFQSEDDERPEDNIFDEDSLTTSLNNIDQSEDKEEISIDTTSGESVTQIEQTTSQDHTIQSVIQSNSKILPPNIPLRILIGTAANGSRNVYWEFGHPGLANRHVIVFGTSGMGKTYAIQCLLCELAKLGQNSLIVDYTDGFLPSKIEEAAKNYIPDSVQEFISLKPLPINPFKSQVSYEAGMEFKDSPNTIAKRIASIFKSVYDLGIQQFPLVIDAITNGINEYGDSFNLEKLLEVLSSNIGDSFFSKSTIQSTITKIKPFIDGKPFTTENGEIGWDDIFSDINSRIRVFQFYKIDKHSARALIEFVLWDLYNFVTSYGNKDLPKVVVLDEVQNLDLGSDAPVAKYLTEGRKHGLSLIIATQTVKGVGGVNDARVSRLFQAELKIFFKPTENEMKEHAQLLHNAITSISVSDWATRLSSLQKGECWVLGRQMNTNTQKLDLKAQKVKITSLEERGFHA
jgi:DNA phosphorothioation-dependent restriction protein DptH